METLVAQENHLFERTTREGEEQELWGLRRLIPPPRPACRLKESGLVSERNVLDDVVFVSPEGGDGDGCDGGDGDLTEELNIEVDYSRWIQRMKEREQQQQLYQQHQQLHHQQQLSFSSEEDSNEKKRSRSCKASTTRLEFETKELTNNATASTSSGSKKRGKSKTETSHVISSGKKRKLNVGAAGAKGCPASLDLLPATKKVCGDTNNLVDSSNFVVLKECNVRARLLDIPPQILEQTTAVAKPSPLLPYQIARSLCRRGLPQVCVKYARIVPPPREAVLELLEQQQQAVAAADKGGIADKKRPGGSRSHPAVAKATKTTERKTGAGGLVSCPARKVEGGNGLEALIPVRRDYLGMNNPFHMGSTEALRKARGLICNREGWRRNNLNLSTMPVP
jgi:hypothetical protein